MATTSTVSGLAAHLRLAIARSNRRLRQEAGSGLSPTLTAALATVERHGPLTPSELAARERIQRPTATRLIGRLEQDGLVTRTADPADGRSSRHARATGTPAPPHGRSSVLANGKAAARLLHKARTRKDAYLARRLRD